MYRSTRTVGCGRMCACRVVGRFTGARRYKGRIVSHGLVTQEPSSTTALSLRRRRGRLASWHVRTRHGFRPAVRESTGGHLRRLLRHPMLLATR